MTEPSERTAPAGPQARALSGLSAPSGPSARLNLASSVVSQGLVAGASLVLQWIASAFPARYFVTVSRAVFLKGAGWSEAWPEVVSLGIFSLVVLTLASALHSRRSR